MTKKYTNKITRPNVIRRTVLPGDYPSKLESFLFPEGLPEYLPKFKSSPELMTIFHILFSIGYNSEVNSMDGFETAEVTTGSLEERMRLIIGADTRIITTYKCHTDFILNGMEFTPMAELPLYQTPTKARDIRTGDLLLIRRDEMTLKQQGVVELQILTNGLFNSSDDDWRVFTGNQVDIIQITKYATKERKKEGSIWTKKS